MAAAFNQLRTGRPRLRRNLPQAYGLVGAWAWEGCRGTDLAGVNHLAPTGAVSYDAARGLGTTAGLAAYQTTMGAGLKIQPPITLVWQGFNLGTTGRDASSVIFGAVYNSTGTSPFNGYEILWDGTKSNIQIGSNSAGSSVSATAGTPTPGTGPLWCAAKFTTTNITVYWISPSNATNGSAVSSINYSSTSQFGFGSTVFGSRNPNVYHDYGLVYNRALTPGTELTWLYERGRDLFAHVRGRVGWTAAMAAAASFQAARSAQQAVIGSGIS